MPSVNVPLMLKRLIATWLYQIGEVLKHSNVAQEQPGPIRMFWPHGSSSAKIDEFSADEGPSVLVLRYHAQDVPQFSICLYHA